MSLGGRRVVVTRAEEQQDELCAKLEGAGATAIRCPTIRIAPPESTAQLDDALADARAFDWIVFTSRNGVRHALSRLQQLGLPASTLAEGRIAAVGPTTERVLRRRGVPVAFVPEEHRSLALARTLPDVEGRTILLARSASADPEAAAILTSRGARVLDAVAYRTELVAPSGHGLAELRDGVDCVTFTSPSTIRGFLEMGPEGSAILEKAAVVTMGPATTEHATEVGVDVDAQAEERSLDGLVAAVGKALATRG